MRHPQDGRARSHTGVSSFTANTSTYACIEAAFDPSKYVLVIRHVCRHIGSLGCGCAQKEKEVWKSSNNMSVQHPTTALLASFEVF